MDTNALSHSEEDACRHARQGTLLPPPCAPGGNPEIRGKAISQRSPERADLSPTVTVENSGLTTEYWAPTHAERGDVVQDSCLGSGTTMMAAEKANRTCYGLEIDAHYVDIIVRRRQKLTGREAVTQLDSRRFSGIAVERKPAGVGV